MKKNLILGAIMLLLATLWFALDTGVAAMVLFHSTERTMIKLRSDAISLIAGTPSEITGYRIARPLQMVGGRFG